MVEELKGYLVDQKGLQFSYQGLVVKLEGV